MRHHAKWCADRSNRCRDISILDFSRWRPPPSWIFEISLVLLRKSVTGPVKIDWLMCRRASNNSVGPRSGRPSVGTPGSRSCNRSHIACLDLQGRSIFRSPAIFMCACGVQWWWEWPRYVAGRLGLGHRALPDVQLQPARRQDAVGGRRAVSPAAAVSLSPRHVVDARRRANWTGQRGHPRQQTQTELTPRGQSSRRLQRPRTDPRLTRVDTRRTRLGGLRRLLPGRKC